MTIHLSGEIRAGGFWRRPMLQRRLIHLSQRGDRMKLALDGLEYAT